MRGVRGEKGAIGGSQALRRCIPDRLALPPVAPGVMAESVPSRLGISATLVERGMMVLENASVPCESLRRLWRSDSTHQERRQMRATVLALVILAALALPIAAQALLVNLLEGAGEGEPWAGLQLGARENGIDALDEFPLFVQRSARLFR